MKNYNVKTLFLIFLATVLWGLGYPVLKISYSYWNIAAEDIAAKLVFAGIRFICAGLILLFFSFAKNKRIVPIPSSLRIRVLLLSLCQTVFQYGFLYVGLALTSGTKGSVLNQLCVFLTIIFTPVFFKSEKISARKLAGCLTGFLGIICMNFSGLSFSLELGDVLVILASCATAAGYLLSKSIPKDFDSVSCTGYQQFLGGFVLLIAGLLAGGRLAVPSFGGILLLLYLTVECAVAFSAWCSLMQNNDPARITVFKFLTPVFGVLFSGVILKEDILTFENMISLVLVCVGVIIVNTTAKRRTEACTDTY